MAGAGRGRGRLLPALVVAAAVLVVAGVIALAAAPGAPASFGWFAYSPLAEDPVSGSFVVWGRQQMVGAGLVVLGLMAAASAVGYLLGRRRTSAPRR